MERAQALGLQFCKDNFPGHPAIVCTHPDGHNSAGNIHVHIVIGSLRVRTVERQPFMDKPCDWEAGKKHRCLYFGLNLREYFTKSATYLLTSTNN